MKGAQTRDATLKTVKARAMKSYPESRKHWIVASEAVFFSKKTDDVRQE